MLVRVTPAADGREPSERTGLRYGWTTGACATAATTAAYTALLTGEFPDPVPIDLPQGQHPAFALAREDAGRRRGHGRRSSRTPATTPTSPTARWSGSTVRPRRARQRGASSAPARASAR